MTSLNNIKEVIKKIALVDDIAEHICFFGGCMPYIIHNKESNRQHSDIDILVEESYMDNIRERLKTNNLYDECLDSLNLDLDRDYGLKANINGVYVEFEPVSLKNKVFTKASFSPFKSLAGIKSMPYIDIKDIIIPIEIDGVKIYSQTPELIMLDKEQYKREKDIIDIDFIKEEGIDKEKYFRIKKCMEMKKEVISLYEDLRKGKKKNVR